MEDCYVEERTLYEPDIPGMNGKDGQNVMGKGVHVQSGADVMLQEEVQVVLTDIHMYEEQRSQCCKGLEDNTGIEDVDMVRKLTEDIDQSWEVGMVDLKMVQQGGNHNFHIDMEMEMEKEHCNYPSMQTNN